MVLKRFQKWKDKHGIGFSGSKAKNERLKIKQQEQGSRDVVNARGRTTGKEYWNPLTKKWQKTPIKRGSNLPGGSHHKGGEIGRKSDKPSEGNFKKQDDTSNNKTLSPKNKAEDANGGRKTNKNLAITKSNVFTKHYKTGKALGVMTRSQRRAYDKAAAEHKKKNKGK